MLRFTATYDFVREQIACMPIVYTFLIVSSSNGRLADQLQLCLFTTVL
jgi:hypothetical protein